MSKTKNLEAYHKLHIKTDIQNRSEQPFLLLKRFDILSELQKISAFADCVDALRNKKYEVLISEKYKQQIRDGILMARLMQPQFVM